MFQVCLTHEENSKAYRSLTGGFSQDMKEQVQDCQAETNRLASQTLGNIRVVRSCRAESYEGKVFDQALDQMRRIKKRKGIFSATFLLMRRVWMYIFSICAALFSFSLSKPLSKL